MFKLVLINAEEITDFIVEFATEPIDEELIREYFNGCNAILKSVSVKSLMYGNHNLNVRNSRKEKKYELLPFKTMPPLIVENGIVIDGNHRLRVVRKNRIKKTNIYEINFL